MSVALPLPRRRRTAVGVPGGALAMGIVMLYLSIIVLLPLAAVVAHSFDGGIDAFWHAVTSRQAVSALRFTILASLAAAAINALFGTLIAWVLVRDQFPGKAAVNALIDLPFALPTIVAGLTLIALYGPRSPLGINVALTKMSVLLAMLFVTLPFVIRAVQPVLLELDRDMEEAAASLGAGSRTIFARVILPNLGPAILSGSALAFARAVGEFGSIVLISGNIPFKTQVSSVFVFKQIESDNPIGASAVSDSICSIVLISGNIPFKTQVSSVFVFKQIESDNPIGASAVSVVLLVVSLLVLFAIRWVGAWGSRHDR